MERENGTLDRKMEPINLGHIEFNIHIRVDGTQFTKRKPIDNVAYSHKPSKEVIKHMPLDLAGLNRRQTQSVMTMQQQYGMLEAAFAQILDDYDLGEITMASTSKGTIRCMQYQDSTHINYTT
jgi:hypothetical protein